jgi:hypothetical protein
MSELFQFATRNARTQFRQDTHWIREAETEDRWGTYRAACNRRVPLRRVQPEPSCEVCWRAWRLEQIHRERLAGILGIQDEQAG